MRTGDGVGTEQGVRFVEGSWRAREGERATITNRLSRSKRVRGASSVAKGDKTELQALQREIKPTHLRHDAEP